MLETEAGTLLLVDGGRRETVGVPDAETEVTFDSRMSREHPQGKQQAAAADRPALTKDGHRIEVVANVGNAEDVRIALSKGVEGIGLLRTGFLYLQTGRSHLLTAGCLAPCHYD